MSLHKFQLQNFSLKILEANNFTIIENIENKFVFIEARKN